MSIIFFHKNPMLRLSSMLMVAELVEATLRQAVSSTY